LPRHCKGHLSFKVGGKHAKPTICVIFSPFFVVSFLLESRLTGCPAVSLGELATKIPRSAILSGRAVACVHWRMRLDLRRQPRVRKSLGTASAFSIRRTQSYLRKVDPIQRQFAATSHLEDSRTAKKEKGGCEKGLWLSRWEFTCRGGKVGYESRP
jgi:hypothetical protein